MEKQNFRNHTKYVPVYHYFVLPVLFLNVIWTAGRAVMSLSPGTVMGFLVAVALAIGAIWWRRFSLKVQDRVIRLEMRLRMKEILPADLQPRINDFTAEQLIAMRFASDAELPGLARKVLEEKIEDKKAIKMLVQDWQADEARA